MNITQAHRLLREQLDKHELYQVEAKMNGRLTSVFGRYRWNTLYNTKKVELSSQLVAINDEEVVKRVILHEIAHALTEGHGHDSVWQAKCLEIGGDGKRCYSIHDTNTIERKRTLLQAYCEEHGDRGRYYRRVNRACGSCCNQYNNGKYSEQYRLQFREV
jgi:predicted SprT family Zn-dependent metalloprotease